jgi:hypothetical protein
MKFVFTTKLEDGDVIVFWEYEVDDFGVYNSAVTRVVFNDVDVLPILSEATMYELDAKALTVYEEQFND